MIPYNCVGKTSSQSFGLLVAALSRARTPYAGKKPAMLRFFSEFTGRDLYMQKRLPVKLNREPLIEAVCELRMSGRVALNTFFPGLLLAKQPEEVSDIQQLPAAMLPEQLRSSDPNLMFAPLVRLKFKGILVLIGERSIIVSNQAPYLGWQNFRALIEEVFSIVFESKLVSKIERYSLKYTNVLDKEKVPDFLAGLNWVIKVGDVVLDTRTTTLRTEAIQGDLATIITITGGVTVQKEGEAPIQGSLIDVDTVCHGKQLDPEDFRSSMSSELDRVRLINKEIFFECLTSEAIDALEPLYE